MTAIQGRDYARIYVKELDRGKASVSLSPEEQQAVDRAMSAGSAGGFPAGPLLRALRRAGSLAYGRVNRLGRRLRSSSR